METFRIRTHVGSDGILKLELPIQMPNAEVDVLVVTQPLISEEVDEMGYPIGYFEDTYGSLADDPIERGPDLPPDIRDEFE